MNSALTARLLAVATGMVFALGLGIAGMTRPSKIIDFLDFFGAWDASLALVMAAAVLVGLGVSPWILRRQSPRLAPRFVLPEVRAIDCPLLFGAAVFGIGWGLAGLCPGPALSPWRPARRRS
ncbi:MAG: DUF6691 family protein [Acidobacteriota bacterium]